MKKELSRNERGTAPPAGTDDTGGVTLLTLLAVVTHPLPCTCWPDGQQIPLTGADPERQLVHNPVTELYPSHYELTEAHNPLESLY